MNQFKPAYAGLRSIVVSSVAVIGLASVAQAQVAELKGLMDNKDFGGSSSFYLPLGNVTTGMPFLSVGAGLLGGSKSGEALLGYGQGFGNVGIRGYAGVGLKDSHHHLFTTAKAGIELSMGGFGLNVSGSIPFGKTRQVARKGHNDVVLVDPTGQQCDPTGACVPVPPSCSNPLPGQVKHCEIGVAVTDPSYEKALKGFEVGLDYQVQVGGVWLRPSLGYYRYGNGIVSGAKAGLEVSVPLISQLSLNIGAGGQKELRGDNKGLSGFGSLGISYHFGQTPVSQLSALEHRFAEAPTRNQRPLTTQTQEGNTVVYRNTNKPGQGIAGVTPDVGAIWDENTRHHFVSNVYLIDAATASQLDEVVAAAEEDSIVLVDGSKGDINLDNTIEFKNAGVGVVGGGSSLKVQATLDGGKTFFSETLVMPGTRPIINQANLSKDVFYAHDIENPIVYGLSTMDGRDGVSFDNTPSARVSEVITMNADRRGFSFISSDGVHLSNSIANTRIPGLREGLYIKNSIETVISRFRVEAPSTEYGYYDNAINIMGASDTLLQEVFVEHAVHGIKVTGSDNTFLNTVTSEANGVGILLLNSKDSFLSNILIEDSPTGIMIEDSKQTTVFNSTISRVINGIDLNNASFTNMSSISIIDGLTGVQAVDSDHTDVDNVYISEMRNGLFIIRSDYTYVSDTIIEQVYDVGIDLVESTNGKLSNIFINGFDEDGIILNETNSIALDNITLKGTSAAGSAGITLVNSGKVGQEVSLSNVLVREADYGYQFDKDSAVKDLRFNAALFVNHICDGVDDATGSILVNGLTKCR